MSAVERHLGSRPGYVTRPVYVAECGNCGEWSAPRETRKAVECLLVDVDGVGMCEPCATDIAQQGEPR